MSGYVGVQQVGDCCFVGVVEYLLYVFYWVYGVVVSELCLLLFWCLVVCVFDLLLGEGDVCRGVMWIGLVGYQLGFCVVLVLRVLVNSVWSFLQLVLGWYLILCLLSFILIVVFGLMVFFSFWFLWVFGRKWFDVLNICLLLWWWNQVLFCFLLFMSILGNEKSFLVREVQLVQGENYLLIWFLLKVLMVKFLG